MQLNVKDIVVEQWVELTYIEARSWTTFKSWKM